MSDLTFLDVSNNHIGDASATVIGKLMARTHTLGMVSLASTSVSNVGAAHLLEAARSNSVVRYIDLEETDVSQELQCVDSCLRAWSLFVLRRAHCRVALEHTDACVRVRRCVVQG